jgi:predicted RNase H-like nuclease (RuvC/YqgF family)
MFLSLKQQVQNTNNDVSTFESKLNELKEQTAQAIKFHNNFVKSDENIKIIVNTTTNNASKISTLENVSIIQLKEITSLKNDISNNSSRIVSINNSFRETTEKLKLDLQNEIQNRDDADIMIQLNIIEEC